MDLLDAGRFSLFFDIGEQFSHSFVSHRKNDYMATIIVRKETQLDRNILCNESYCITRERLFCWFHGSTRIASGVFTHCLWFNNDNIVKVVMAYSGCQETPDANETGQ